MLRFDRTPNHPSHRHGRSRRRRDRSDLNLGHVRVSGSCATTFFANGQLGVLEELQTGGCRTPVLHLVNCLANEAQQVIDILSLHEVVLLLLEEEQVGVEDLDQKVKILGLCHADLRRFERFAELGHDLLTLLAAIAEEQMRGQADCLSLQILLEQLVAVADCICAKRLKVFRAKARERVQS